MELSKDLQPLTKFNVLVSLKAFKLSLVVLVLFSQVSFTNAQVSTDDFLALRALYLSTNGANWENRTGWENINTATPQDVNSDWHGVIVNNGRVADIDLSSNNLQGFIPFEIGLLTELRNLNLGGNTLIGDIPFEISSLKNLRGLFLANNALDGSIPFNIGELTELRTFVLSNNQLSGEIPESVGALTNLLQFRIEGNQFSGTILSQLGNLTQLNELLLYENNLSGTIPPEIGNLTNVDALWLYGNNLEGSIPEEIGNMTNLNNLRLEDNQLSGEIPASLGNLTLNLREIHLQNNQLSGSIPPELGNALNLTVLELQNNQLSGSIPPELGNIDIDDTDGDEDLITLRLDNNHLSGSIPLEITELQALEILRLDQNLLSGNVPNEFTSFENLQVLGLANNQLEDLPNLTSIGTLTDLQVAGNLFTFADLEPNVALLSSTSNFGSQKASIPVLEHFLKLDESSSLTLSAKSDGINTQFLWVFKGDSISLPSGDSTFVINTFTPSITGKYYAKVTNPLFSGLLLTSDTIEVQLGMINAPVALNVSGQTSGIDLNWVDNSNVEIGYGIERSENNTNNFSLITTIPANSTNYTDTNVRPNISYFYRVFAIAPEEADDSNYGNIQGASNAEVITSQEEDNFSRNIYIYPNPFFNTLQLDVNHPNTGILQVEIMDLYGKTLRRFSHKKNAQSFHSALQFSMLKPGIYFLRLLLEDHIAVFKLHKTNVLR